MAGFGLNQIAPKFVCKLSKPGDAEEKDEKFKVLIEGKVVEPGPGDTPPSMGDEFEVEVVATSGTAKVTTKADTVNGEFSVTLEGLEAKDYKVKAIARLYQGGKVYPFMSNSQPLNLKEKSGPKVANQIEVDVRKKVASCDEVLYDLIVCPVDGKHKGVKGTIYAFPDDDKCVVDGGPFPTNGDKPTIITVAVKANTGLTLRMDGTDISKDVLLDGPVQFEGKGWALVAGIGSLLTIVLFAVAVGATFFHSLPTPPVNEADTWWTATETAPVKASAKWLWWWLIDALLFTATTIFAGVTAKKNAKVLVWKARKFNAERKYETKADGGDKKPTAEAVKQGSNRILDWLNIALNSFDLFHEKIKR